MSLGTSSRGLRAKKSYSEEEDSSEDEDAITVVSAGSDEDVTSSAEEIASDDEDAIAVVSVASDEDETSTTSAGDVSAGTESAGAKTSSSAKAATAQNRAAAIIFEKPFKPTPYLFRASVAAATERRSASWKGLPIH